MPRGGSISEKGWKLFDPISELSCLNSLQVIILVFEDAEDVVGQILSDGTSHSCEPLHKKIDGLLAIDVERVTGPICCVLPRIEMVKPDFIYL